MVNKKVKEKTFFAVASLGKNRWYWVVWPSLNLLHVQKTRQHMAEGYESTKAEAVDQALETAGMYGEWVAAKYAKQYHQTSRRKHTGNQNTKTTASLATLEFLYQDIYDDATNQWYSVPHRIAKKTKKYVYVEQQPYKPEHLTGSWLDDKAPTFRLSRQPLEQGGYTLASIAADIDDPLFFTTPYQERIGHYITNAPASLQRLNLSFPCTEAEVKTAYRILVKRAHPDQGGNHDEFLALQTAYEHALQLCRYQP